MLITTGSEKQIKWANDIQVQFTNYWAELERKNREDYEDDETAGEIHTELNGILVAIAPYAHNASWWIDEGRCLINRHDAKMVLHRIRVYPDTLTRYL